MATPSIDQYKQDDVSYLVEIARDAFGHLVQGISVFDENLSLVFFNDRFSELLDFPKGLIKVGTNLDELFRYNAERGEYGPGDIGTQVQERVILAKQFQPHSFQRQRPNGTILQIDGSPLSSGGFVTTYTDITEKEQYEAFLKSVIEASPAGFGISRQSDGKLSFLNTRLAEMFQIPVREMIGLQARTLYTHPETRNEILGKIQQEGQVNDIEAQFKRRDGSNFPALISLNPTTYQNEPSLFAWLYDISNLKQAQEQQSALERELNQAQKLEAIGQLAGGIAHEINTPSQYVWDNLKFLHDAQKDFRGLLDLCLTQIEQMTDSPAQQAACERIDRYKAEIDLDYLLEEVPTAIDQSIKGISEISRIVLAMKEFTHPGGDNGKATVDINHMLENTLTIARNEWKHLAKVELDLDNSLPYVKCNPGELNQAFLNLLVNAAHAIEARGPGTPGVITIQTQQWENQVIIRIGDNGSGIPASIQDKIFEPFFTTKEVGKGTGQGLSITRNIVVKKHGGDLSYVTEAGQGTTFRIALPILGND
ncbi:PAS-domain containing protein [Sedimenticola sp.]|uniref:PAS-domain containing protein n=1 Tax=Sedimenticola sp. TaxID=1940285 RepID=UPI003D0DB4A0